MYDDKLILNRLLDFWTTFFKKGDQNFDSFYNLIISSEHFIIKICNLIRIFDYKMIIIFKYLNSTTRGLTVLIKY